MAAPTSTSRRNPLLGPASFEQRPTGEIGTSRPRVMGGGDWSSFLEEAETAPDLIFPRSIETFHAMRTDSQVDALHLGTVSPIKEFRWSIDPNGSSAKLAENAAADLGLPIKGHEDDPIPRARNKVDWDAFLTDALLAPLYGFFDFEAIGTVVEAKEWRLDKLAPRHPRLTESFRESPTGELEAIRQRVAGPRTNGLGMPEPIPADRLVRFVWRAEAGSFIGRSMLRSMFREWAVKDRVMRIAAINLQRAGGVPVGVGAPGMSDSQLKDLAQMARQFKVSEGGGGAIPFGTDLKLVGGSVPDAISLLQYCDEAMARVWALMLVQLGMTATGNRALGAEFAIYAARAQRAWAKWIKASVDGLLDRYVEWNDPFQTHAPIVAFEQAKPDQLSLADLVALIEAGAITVDPELEEWIRNEGGLPEKPEEPEEDETPEAPPAVLGPDGQPIPPQGLGPDGKPLPTPKLPSPTVEPQSTAPTFARGGATAHPLGVERVYGGIRASLTLPARDLRRPPSANEIRAAVDFRGLDTAHSDLTTRLQQEWLKDVLPEQIATMGAQIRALPAISKAAVMGVQAPTLGLEALERHLTDAAVSGAGAAKREIGAQGKAADHVALVPDTPEALAPRVADQAAALAKLNANAVSLAAQRKAASLVSEGGRTPGEVASAMEDHLKGQKHVWEREQLRGAVTMAQNQGRIAAFESQPDAATATYEASELLDDRTCDPCAAIDGTVFDSLEEASEAYAGGGYVDCEGGPDCRGTLVAVYPEQNPESGPGPLAEPAEPYVQPEPGEPLAPEMTQEREAPEPAPTPEPASAPGPSEGAMLARAQSVTSHDEAVSLLKEMGVGEVDFGGKIQRAAKLPEGASNREHAMTLIRGTTEAVADAHDTFGAKAVHIDRLLANSALKRSVYPKGIGGAIAAVVTMTNRFTAEQTINLVVNDALSFEKMAAADLFERSGGLVARATTDVRGRITHEMGHVLEDNLTGFSMQLPKMLAESRLASTAEGRGYASSISQYAASKSVETWAESFATLMREGGTAVDFGVQSTNLQIKRMTPSDADVKGALVKLRESFNEWLAVHHPDVGRIPER